MDLETLAEEHEALSARFDLLTQFTMHIIDLLAKDEQREALRDGIARLIVTSRQSSNYDTLNDAQDLLRSFEAVMPPPGA